MSKLIDLSGLRIGKWIVLGKHSGTRNKRTYWLCRCDCGTEKPVLSEHLRGGKTMSCGCLRFEIAGKKHHQWSGVGEISGHFWSQLRGNAKRKRPGRKRLEFSITLEYIWDLYVDQGGKCALSGLSIDFVPLNHKTKGGASASLDRIDSSIGYIAGNVQWVHKDINIMKNKFSQEYFLDMCETVVENREV